ncbi:bifunctional metallophosphatase/5'-nucleotidase [Synoicihabitans lomoniglobus]|uniref:Bifunctional UDP-sugar hydrolase/5'-nucleotidase n=1 Tax=Synoicihabitans lomoniglobus TaxID=2909285 RepID=A0AAE9ZXH4_9BACT|nr:bifunctional metallophosphatase/5'-nucleotidase [Opitutaceae bacterium LMO-M01]WED65321.1 bifunctional UDP-sugar hydrolase/5'-nucleotidase [Opitutaceae bacterium LMO-M01]
MVPRLRHAFALSLLLTGFVVGADRTHVTVLSTTDLHGHIHPVDYYTQTPAENGLAKIGTLIRRARALDPEVILLDSGDTIQGTPLAYHVAVVAPPREDPMMAAMNSLGFDALAIGNHEYNYGLDVLNRARRSARFPWISGNICIEGTTDPAYAPYIVKQVRGVRVGILGLTTPGVPAWEDPDHITGLDFTDPVAAAHRWVRELRQRTRVDVVVVAMHMGIEENILTGIPNPGQVPHENAALRIAREVPGVDVILMGHTHREVPSLTVNGVLLTQAGRWGEHLSRTTLLLERSDPTASWQLIGKTATTHPVTAEVPPDPQILALTQNAHEATEAWLDQPIGRTSRTLSAAQARVQDSAIIDLIQRVQLDAGEADVSLTACFNTNALLPVGEVTVRDIAGLYVYENSLVVLELTGAQLKQALEHSARFFRPGQRGMTAEELIDPQVPGYNFDIAEGVDYVIDLNRRVGDRITDLNYRGRRLDPRQKLKVAINNYRHNGGGGYAMFQDAPIISRSNRGIRDLIIDWVIAHPDLPTEPSHNWRIRLP